MPSPAIKPIVLDMGIDFSRIYESTVIRAYGHFAPCIWSRAPVYGLRPAVNHVVNSSEAFAGSETSIRKARSAHMPYTELLTSTLGITTADSLRTAISSGRAN